MKSTVYKLDFTKSLVLYCSFPLWLWFWSPIFLFFFGSSAWIARGCKSASFRCSCSLQGLSCHDVPAAVNFLVTPKQFFWTKHNFFSVKIAWWLVASSLASSARANCPERRSRCAGKAWQPGLSFQYDGCDRPWFLVPNPGPILREKSTRLLTEAHDRFDIWPTNLGSQILVEMYSQWFNSIVSASVRVYPQFSLSVTVRPASLLFSFLLLLPSPLSCHVFLGLSDSRTAIVYYSIPMYSIVCIEVTKILSHLKWWLSRKCALYRLYFGKFGNSLEQRHWDYRLISDTSPPPWCFNVF